MKELVSMNVFDRAFIKILSILYEHDSEKPDKELDVSPFDDKGAYKSTKKIFDELESHL